MAWSTQSTNRGTGMRDAPRSMRSSRFPNAVAGGGDVEVGVAGEVTVDHGGHGPRPVDLDDLEREAQQVGERGLYHAPPAGAGFEGGIVEAAQPGPPPS